VRRWKIYYDDGSTFSDRDGSIEKAPGRGVVIVAQEDADCGRHILHMKDFYYWETRDGRWYGADAFGRDDYLDRTGWRKVIAGRNTGDANYSRLFALAAFEDSDLPPKTARLVGEPPQRGRDR